MQRIRQLLCSPHPNPSFVFLFLICFIFVFENYRNNRIRRQSQQPQVSLYGVKLEFSDPPAVYETEGTSEPTLLVRSHAQYRLYGSGWKEDTLFVWTDREGVAGGACEYIIGDKSKVCWMLYCVMWVWHTQFTRQPFSMPFVDNLV